MVKDSTSIKKRRKNTAPTEGDGEIDIYTVHKNFNFFIQATNHLFYRYYYLPQAWSCPTALKLIALSTVPLDSIYSISLIIDGDSFTNSKNWTRRYHTLMLPRIKYILRTRHKSFSFSQEALQVEPSITPIIWSSLTSFCHCRSPW